MLVIFSPFFIMNKRKKHDNDSKEEKNWVNEIYDKERYSEKDSKKNNKIISLIKADKETDVKEIAKVSNCSLEECVLRIRYLEENGLIPNIHLNTNIFKLIVCNDEDEALLNKYLPTIRAKNIDKVKFGQNNCNFDEVLYLYKKGLIPEIEIDEDNKKITYIDFNKKIKRDLVSVRCKNCGALNDVNRDIKTKCKYCDNYIYEIDKE